jgi:hypothetical protein
MNIIVLDSGVITTDDTGYPPDSAIDDIIIQGSVGSPVETTQQVVNSFVAEPGDQVSLLLRDINIAACGSTERCQVRTALYIEYLPP